MGRLDLPDKRRDEDEDGRPRVGSLFSGIGGMDYGLARAGFRHVFFCEADSYRRDVLAARWSGVPIYDDVRMVGRGVEWDWVSRGESHSTPGAPRGACPVDLLCGGFPCQDLSVAGRRAGLAGERSGLFFEFARIIDAFRPGWVLVENVPGLLSSNGGRDFGVVLGTLADLGYGVAWRVLDSRFFGVPQRRRRVFILGALADGDPRAAAERAGAVLAVGSRCPRHPPAGGKAGADVAVASLSGIGNGGPDDNDGQGGRLVAATIKAKRGKSGGGLDVEEQLVSHTLTAKCGKRDDGESETFIAHALTSKGADASEDGTGRGAPLVTSVTLASDSISADNLAQPSTKRNGDPGVIAGADIGVRRLTPRECERLQGVPDDWTQLGDTSDSRRYSALGDAVTATVAEWIGKRLAEEAYARHLASHRPAA